MQIRTRLTFLFTLVVTLILIVAFSVLYFFLWRSGRLEFERRLRDRALTSAVLLLKVEEVDSALLKVIDQSKHDILYGENISILDSSGKELYTNNDTLRFLRESEIVEDIRKHGTFRSMQGNYTVVGLPFRDAMGRAYFIIAEAIDVEGFQRFRDLRTLLVVLLFVLVAVVAFVGWLYSGRTLMPIKKIMNEVESISTDNLSQRLYATDSNDEIGKLVLIFNGLLDRIENGFNLQKTFVANVSHELKNPLTKITSQLEVTLLSDRDTAEYKALVSSVLEDIRELNQLSNGLLDLATLSQDNVKLHTALVRLDELIWEVRETVQALNTSYRVEVLAIGMPEDERKLCIEANSQLLKTAFENIVENACKFSEDHSATVSLICSDKELEVRIFDNGPGIAKRDLERIFQPFYRADSSARVKGHGIGLSLSRRIIEAHKGKLEIESSPGQGTQVNVGFSISR